MLLLFTFMNLLAAARGIIRNDSERKHRREVTTVCVLCNSSFWTSLDSFPSSRVFNLNAAVESSMDTVLGYYLGSSRLLLANITNTTSNGGEAGSNGGGGSVHVPASSNERIRTILVVLYVCVLALCFLTPIVYYFRLHVEERHARRLRELEVAGIRSALERSSTDHAGESQAARRKYIEERRARILQLFRPVATVSFSFSLTTRLPGSIHLSCKQSVGRY